MTYHSTVLKNNDYPFRFHKVYVPSQVKIIIEDWLYKQKQTKYTLRTFIDAKKRDNEYSTSVLYHTVIGKTQNPTVKTLEELRKIVVSTASLNQHKFKQLPLIRLSDVGRMCASFNLSGRQFVSALNMDYNFEMSEKKLYNIMQGKQDYRYEEAWALTYFFIDADKKKYLENKYEKKWDFYDWVIDRMDKEGIVTQDTAKETRDRFQSVLKF